MNDVPAIEARRFDRLAKLDGHDAFPSLRGIHHLSISPLAAAFTQLLVQTTQEADAAAAKARLQRLEHNQASYDDWFAAAAALAQSTPALAITVLDHALQRWPDDIAMRYLRGNALRMSGQPARAEEALRDVIRRMPEHATASVSLAFLLREQGRMSALAEVMLTFWRRAPRTPDRDLRTLAFLRDCGRIADAALMLPGVLGSPHLDAPIHALAGEIMLALGGFEKARDQFAAAIQADAESSAAWLRLAHTHRFEDRPDPDLVALTAASLREDLGDATRTCIAFGLGKAHDDLDDTASAVQHFAAGNARWRANHPWSGEQWQRFVDDRVKAPPLRACAAREDITPVFIVGLPRTGTTLVASQLARDPSVRNRGELNWIGKLADKVLADRSPIGVDQAAQLYLTQLRQDDPPARCYIDKNPLNFRHLDLIAAMVPNARVIHCRRDLRDVALSAWSSHFMHDDMAWSYDFADIETFANGYSTLMEHWRQHSPLPILDVDYETLVAEPDATIRRVREFLLLGDEAPGPVRNDPSSITTASVWQARQPVYTSSVGRWRRYATELPELGRFADARMAGLSRPA